MIIWLLFQLVIKILQWLEILYSNFVLKFHRNEFKQLPLSARLNNNCYMFSWRLTMLTNIMINTNTRTLSHTCIYTHLHSHSLPHTHIHTNVYVCKHTWSYFYRYMHICAHIYRYLNMCLYEYTHICIRMCVWGGTMLVCI